MARARTVRPAGTAGRGRRHLRGRAGGCPYTRHRALDHPAHPDGAETLALSATRRTEWLRGYRDTWGFVSLVLRRTAD
ncbi:hypothetical protein [Streptomyces sp. ITFR-6]|uniref:hypothetical protein n=1 Tax=Streptomyces sp. ITFR-6 TaxID=3075197 RepID=UPI0037DA621D